MNQLHRKLIKKQRWYAAWHKDANSAAVHWAAFVLVTLLVGLIVVNSINPFLHGSSTRAAGAFYASPNASSAGDGTISNPWTISKALTQPAGAIPPGSTIYLRGGTYSVSSNLVINLTGTSTAPITVSSYPGEWAVISDTRETGEHGTFDTLGAWTIYRDFEVTNSNPDRLVPYNTLRPMGFHIRSANSKFINLVIHDTGQAFGFWKEAVDSELYGNIVYNNGTNNTDSDRTHGHGEYGQNDSGTKRIVDNIFFNQFGWGIHDYPNPGNLVGFYYEGNILFNNGSLTDPTLRDPNVRYNNILNGAYSPYYSGHISVINNYTYQPDTQINQGSKTGVNACFSCIDIVDNQDLIVKGNYFVGGIGALYISRWKDIQVTGNTLYNTNLLSALDTSSTVAGGTYVWDNNRYFDATATKKSFAGNGVAATFTQWKQATGFDTNSSYATTVPAAAEVFVRPNQYQTGRANVVVYNWPKANTVSANLSTSGLVAGQSFTIKDVQNYFGSSVVSGVYDPANPVVTLPMTGTTATQPVTSTNIVAPHTSSVFGAFVVLPGAIATPTPPPSSPPPVTTPPPTPSVTPSITSFSVTAKTATSATITFSSTQSTTASISYGVNKSNLNLSKADATQTTSHSVTLTNLAAGATYYYQITVSNQNGSATSIISNFRTRSR